MVALMADSDLFQTQYISILQQKQRLLFSVGLSVTNCPLKAKKAPKMTKNVKLNYQKATYKY